MSPRTTYILAAVAVALIALFILPGWVAGLIILAALAAPVAAYLMLDPSQRRRLRERRKQIGR
jgi:multisubunit Na+/H+ antiporter MnhG subunit